MQVKQRRDLNLYTGLLSAVGMVAIVDFLWNLHSLPSSLVLLVTLTCIILNIWPLNVADGLMWNGAVIGVVFLGTATTVHAAVFAMVISTAVGYISRSIVTRRKTRVIRFVATLGMYFTSLIVAHYATASISLLPKYVQAFLGVFSFETCNLLLLLGIMYSFGRQQAFRTFFKRFNVYPVIFGSLAVWRLLAVPQGHRMFFDLMWTALMLSLLFIMSNRYTNAINAQRQIENKYQIIAHHTSDLFAVIQSDGVVTYASPSHRMFGIDPSEVENKTVSQYIESYLGAERADTFKQAIDVAIANNATQSVEISSKAKRCFESVVSPVVNAAGRVTHLIVVSRDITERKQADELLRKSEKLAVIGELAAGVAHEIRNPLTVLKGFLQVFRSKLNEYRSEYDIVWNEVKRIEEIISEFLLMAKPETHRVFGYKNPNLAILEVAQLLGAQANYNGVEIHVQCEENLPSIYCHESSMKQVLMNVIKNAIEAMPNGGMVHVSSRSDGQRIILQVSDTGHGIASDVLGKLGEPFYTTKKKGTGLGLMVTHNIIRDHGGDITFDSEIGKGTTVTIRLPIENKTVKAEQTMVSARAEARTLS